MTRLVIFTVGVSGAIGLIIRTFAEFFEAERDRLRERTSIFDKVVKESHARKGDVYIEVDGNRKPKFPTQTGSRDLSSFLHEGKR
jgi:hypothetical protein